MPVDLDAQGDPFVHGDGERLGAAHTAQARGERDRARQRSIETPPGDLGETLVGSLQDSLGADVDPRTRRHLAVHREAEMLQPPELLPVGPVGHQMGVGDQHPRRHLVGAEHANRFAGLDQHRLVVLEFLQGSDQRVEGLPAPSSATGAPVDDQVVRTLGDVRVEVVHQHSHGRLLLPPLAGEGGARWCSDRSGSAHAVSFLNSMEYAAP